MDTVIFDDGPTGVNVLLRDRVTTPEAVALSAEGAPVDSMRNAEV